jgi:hypothetical protein
LQRIVIGCTALGQKMPDAVQSPAERGPILMHGFASALRCAGASRRG